MNLKDLREIASKAGISSTHRTRFDSVSFGIFDELLAVVEAALSVCHETSVNDELLSYNMGVELLRRLAAFKEKLEGL